MANLFKIIGLFLLLCCGSGLAASVAQFPSAGTIQTTTGTARLAAVTAFDKTSGTARVVIDARDKFGNPVRLFRTVGVVGSKLRAFGARCIKNALGCAAAAVLAGVVSYYGWELGTASNGSDTLISGSGTSSECPLSYVSVPDTGGTYRNTWIGMPCLDRRLSNRWYYHTTTTSPALDEWATVHPPLEREEWVANAQVGPAYRVTVYRYQRAITSESPAVDPAAGVEVLPDQIVQAFLEPEMLQIEPGLYPDIWETVDISDVAVPEENIPLDPQPDQDPLQESNPDLQEDEELMDMDSIEHDTLDLSEYLDWGGKWLPRACPADTHIYKSVSFDWSLACTFLEDYMAPAIRLFALFGFVAIVFRGIS